MNLTSLANTLRTRNMTTGANIYVFGYDSNGLLSSITHDNGKQTLIERDPSGVAQAIVGPYGQTTLLGNFDADGYLGAATNPLGQSAQVSYSTSPASLGLVSIFTNWRGFASTINYDAVGNVTKDQDSLGGFKMLNLLSETPTASTVQLQTALGVTTQYQFQQLTDGEHDTTTWPDGTQTISSLSLAEVTSTLVPDGTSVNITRGPDPTWGMTLPTTTTTTTLPSGLKRVQTTSRVATVSSADPAVLLSETVTNGINGRTTNTTYSAALNNYVTRTPVGRTTTRYVDTNLRTTLIQRPSIADLAFAYDTDNRLTTITQGTRVTARTYYPSGDINGYLATLTNPLSQTTSFVPDALGRTLQQTLDIATTSFTWDGQNNLTSVTPPGKPTHVQDYSPVDLLQDYIPPAAGLTTFATNYQYNLDKQLLQETRPDAVVTNRSYDPAGRLNLLTMPTGSLGYTYYQAGCTTTGCAAGKLASISGPGTENLSFTYDGQLQKSVSWGGLVTGGVSWTYDTDFRKITETAQAGTTSATAAFGYDADSLLTCVSPTTCPSGANALTITRDPQNALLSGTSVMVGMTNNRDSYTYNTYGELATYQFKFSASTPYSVTYDTTSAPRDALGRVVQKTETLQGTTHVFGYTYDVQGRLTDVTRDGTAIEHYGYDLNGNRTTATVNGATVNPTYDDQDRLLTYGGTTFTYTANGELRTKTDSSGTTTYTYDAMGSLIAVNLPDGRLIEYVTDGKGRRIGKMVNGAVTKQWLYRDQLKQVAELDGSGNLVSQFIYGTKTNVPDLVIRGGATYRLISDQLGSPVYAINTANSSDVPFQASYATFGERTLISGTDDWMPFGFAGGHYDLDTKLTRFGARDYDAKFGRWMSKDPISFHGGQPNFYSYVGNNPIDSVDPQGTELAACIVTAVVCVGVIGYEALNTVLAYRTCMNNIEKASKNKDSSGGVCDPLVDEASPDQDIAKAQSKCMNDLTGGLARSVPEDTICGGLVLAACTFPAP